MKQWRQARARRQRAATANTLERLRADERLLQLEFELVGVHGLTLPPADRPVDGIRRQSELRLLDQALGRLQSARCRAQLRHWGLRLLTLGLWGLLDRLSFARQRGSHQRASLAQRAKRARCPPRPRVCASAGTAPDTKDYPNRYAHRLVERLGTSGCWSA